MVGSYTCLDEVWSSCVTIKDGREKVTTQHKNSFSCCHCDPSSQKKYSRHEDDVLICSHFVDVFSSGYGQGNYNYCIIAESSDLTSSKKHSPV
jgi:hypothetical protein